MLGEPERLLCLVNAPPTGDARNFPLKEIERCQERALAQLQRCGLTVNPVGTVATTPADFDHLYPATGGALYGPAMHGWRAAFRRPGSRSKLRGLYLAGGSVHPGSGVPMAAISGTLAADCLLADTSPVRRRVAGLAPARSGHAD